MSNHPHCPACRGCITQLDLVGQPQQPLIEAGDLVLCERCGCIGIYGDDLSLRLPDEAELRQVLAEPHIMAALASIYRQRTITGMMPA